MFRTTTSIVLAKLILFGVFLTLAGCTPATIGPTVEDQLLDAQRQSASQKKELAQLGRELAEREKVIATLRALGGEKRLANLFTVSEIKLHRYTGGVN
ncbi:MAG TPA: hypothetical protein ENL03_00700, partial [Phycisphaerae bacterium]|nr:hypothetical protein [Phycisphaerae bacterium]